MYHKPDGRWHQLRKTGNGYQASIRAEAAIKDSQERAYVQTVTKNKHVLKETVLHRLRQLPSAKVALAGKLLAIALLKTGQ